MSALFGFTGPPCREWLVAMGATLRHRTRASVEYVETPLLSVGYGHDDACDGLGVARGGVAVRGEALVAVAGFLTALPDGGEARESEPVETHLARLMPRGQQSLEDILAQVRGDFVMVAFDGRRLQLVRDAAGLRSLSYASHAGRLFFAVEPKAILAVPGFPRRIRHASLAQYLAFSFVPPPRTMLEGLHALPAGHIAHVEKGACTGLTRFFHLEAEEVDRSEHEALSSPPHDALRVSRFREQFSEVVAARVPREGPVGVFLSGGLDSSLVAAEVAEQAPGRVCTYSLHFGSQYPHELAFARSVADRIGSRHTEVLLQPQDFLPRLREMIWQLDDPIGDPITMPNYELARRVSAEHRVVFNGEGGDPCFGGPKNLPMLLQHWYGGVSRGEHFREEAYLASYRRAYEEVGRLLTPDVAREIDPERDLVGVLRPFFRTPRPVHFLNKLMAINIRLKGAHLILPKVERMLAASGITPLSPLFSEEMVRLSMQLPPSLKLSRGVEKVILKRAFEWRLPQAVIDRPKSGMRVPVHFWFQGEMRRYARTILSRKALREGGLFDPQRVKQLLDYSTEEGPGRYGLRLWMLLTIELWRRILVEGESV